MSVAQTVRRARWWTRCPVERLSAARLAFQTASADDNRHDAGKLFSSQYLRRLSAVLPLEEISVILEAEQYREQGLASSRAGDSDTAAALLSQAAATCEQAQLSRHASLSALSFQLAAEAYVKHRRRDYSGAIRDLENAILTATELERVHGHEMEFRRVHLARNILRVRASVPLDGVVVADSLALLLYIGGNKACWPIAAGRGAGNPARMAESQSVWAMDELLINLALPTIDLGETAHLLPIPEDWSFAHPDLLASLHWCHALTSLAQGNQGRFLNHATSFFELGSGSLVHAGRHLERVCDDLEFPPG